MNFRLYKLVRRTAFWPEKGQYYFVEKGSIVLAVYDRKESANTLYLTPRGFALSDDPCCLERYCFIEAVVR